MKKKEKVLLVIVFVLVILALVVLISRKIYREKKWKEIGEESEELRREVKKKNEAITC